VEELLCLNMLLWLGHRDNQIKRMNRIKKVEMRSRKDEEAVVGMGVEACYDVCINKN